MKTDDTNPIKTDNAPPPKCSPIKLFLLFTTTADIKTAKVTTRSKMLYRTNNIDMHTYIYIYIYIVKETKGMKGQLKYINYSSLYT